MSNMILNSKEEIVLAPLTEDYSKRIYGREISKKQKINQKTVSNTLNRLEKKHILKFITEGKNKYFYLNKLNPNTKEIIKILEISKKIRFLEKYKNYIDLFQKIEIKTKGLAIIFGSYANYTANKNSDIDLAIIGEIEDISELEKTYGIKINIINIKEDKFFKEEALVKEIIKNHIILKGVEEFLNKTW